MKQIGLRQRLDRLDALGDGRVLPPVFVLMQYADETFGEALERHLAEHPRTAELWRRWHATDRHVRPADWPRDQPFEPSVVAIAAPTKRPNEGATAPEEK